MKGDLKRGLISLVLILTLGLGIGLALAQEEEAYSPEEVVPIVEPVAPVPVKPTNAVQNIEVVDLPEKVRIIIHTTQPAEYIIGKIYKPKMLYIDILNSVNDLPKRRYRVKKGPVKRIRSSQYQVLPTEISRIVVDLNKWVKHEIAREENKLYLEFYKPEVLIAKAKVPPEKETLPEEKKVPPEEEKEKKALLLEHKLISVSFTDAPMSAVLNFLAEMSGYNIVASAEVTAGTVTITLKDVPVMTALSTILEMQGLWYTKEKNIIRVMTIDEFKATLAVKADLTRIFVLQYADAANLATVLNNVLGGAVIKKMPRISLRVAGETTTGAGAELVKAIQASKSMTFKGKTFVIPEARTNSLIITTDDPRNFIMLEKLIKELDTEVPQVLLEVMIAEVTLGPDETDVGLQWVWGDVGLPGGFDGVMRWDEYPEAATTPGVTGADTENLYTREHGQYKLILWNEHVRILFQALQETHKVDVLSTPRILTLNNQQAKIQVGYEYPVLKYDKWIYKDIGIMLNITPKINKERFVNLTLNQEIIEYYDDNPFDYPIFSKRVINSSGVVKDGYTLVIGGLIKTSRADTAYMIPWLGKIPGLGYLFKRSIKKTENVEIIMFVTPYVLTSPGEGTRMTRKQARDLSSGKVSEKDIHVPEAKIEIPELEETQIPEIEEKKK